MAEDGGVLHLVGSGRVPGCAVCDGEDPQTGVSIAPAATAMSNEELAWTRKKRGLVWCDHCLAHIAPGGPHADGCRSAATLAPTAKPLPMSAADNQEVQDRVDKVIGDLTAGSVMPKQVDRLGEAVDKAKRDEKLRKAVR